MRKKLKPSKILDKISRLEELFLGWLLLALALIAFTQVVLRYLFHSGFTWGEELSRYLCVLLTFLGAALGVERGSHFSMDILQRLLPDSLKIYLARLIHLINSVIFSVVTWYGVVQVARLKQFASHSPALQLPMYIPYLIIPICGGLMTLRSLYKSIFPEPQQGKSQP